MCSVNPRYIEQIGQVSYVSTAEGANNEGIQHIIACINIIQYIPAMHREWIWWHYGEVGAASELHTKQTDANNSWRGVVTNATTEFQRKDINGVPYRLVIRIGFEIKPPESPDLPSFTWEVKECAPGRRMTHGYGLVWFGRHGDLWLVGRPPPEELTVKVDCMSVMEFGEHGIMSVWCESECFEKDGGSFERMLESSPESSPGESLESSPDSLPEPLLGSPLEGLSEGKHFVDDAYESDDKSRSSAKGEKRMLYSASRDGSPLTSISYETAW